MSIYKTLNQNQSDGFTADMAQPKSNDKERDLGEYYSDGEEHEDTLKGEEYMSGPSTNLVSSFNKKPTGEK